ncbi:MAG: inositol oxygenase family protein [Acidobacteriaceae bacterium]|jgi:inositol oxygenase
MAATPDFSQQPLKHVDEWDDFVAGRYRENKEQADFRKYEANSPIAEFYRLNHAGQSLEFVLDKEREYGSLSRGKRGIWEAADYLNTLVDDSDPDTDLSQTEHLLQTSEAIRADGHPRWMVLAGFIHDLGKVLCLYGEPQWAVVGDTFPVGCTWSDTIVFPEYFGLNPDAKVPAYQTENGIYEPHCGLDQVHMSWGHDEYIYRVTRDYLPEPAHYMLRYHSFYPAHRHGAYQHLMSDHDIAMFEWVQKFNPYDLYSKGSAKPNVKELRPYYEDLVSEYFPDQIAW